MAEPADRLQLRNDFSLLIDGKLVASKEQLDVINPAYGAVFARCPAAGRAQLDAAVAAARRAFATWKGTTYAARAALVKRLSQALRDHQGEDDLQTQRDGSGCMDRVDGEGETDQ